MAAAAKQRRSKSRGLTGDLAMNLAMIGAAVFAAFRLLDALSLFLCGLSWYLLRFVMTTRSSWPFRSVDDKIAELIGTEENEKTGPGPRVNSSNSKNARRPSLPASTHVQKKRMPESPSTSVPRRSCGSEPALTQDKLAQRSPFSGGTKKAVSEKSALEQAVEVAGVHSIEPQAQVSVLEDDFAQSLPDMSAEIVTETVSDFECARMSKDDSRANATTSCEVPDGFPCANSRSHRRSKHPKAGTPRIDAVDLPKARASQGERVEDVQASETQGERVEDVQASETQGERVEDVQASETTVLHDELSTQQDAKRLNIGATTATDSTDSEASQQDASQHVYDEVAQTNAADFSCDESVRQDQISTDSEASQQDASQHDYKKVARMDTTASSSNDSAQQDESSTDSEASQQDVPKDEEEVDKSVMLSVQFAVLEQLRQSSLAQGWLEPPPGLEFCSAGDTPPGLGEGCMDEADDIQSPPGLQAPALQLNEHANEPGDIDDDFVPQLPGAAFLAEVYQVPALAKKNEAPLPAKKKETATSKTRKKAKYVDHALLWQQQQLQQEQMNYAYYMNSMDWWSGPSAGM
eukprot:TRINITY_DN3458_c0_g1_i2.p1 TRINITY_DN3458_c0_g1~~TRINITY_DN3458_c0_g1_i2.p1  ORF type:complete len:579 (-),score=103.18 TRINITY_DN3458_c0_g1_i2:122-1858(-)